MKNKIFTLLLLYCCLPVVSWGNGLTISNISRAGNNVTFDIAWSNSWRVSTCPINWDAVWVFVKFRDCGANPETQWIHGLVNTSLPANNFGGSLEPVLADGAAIGIDPAPNNTGVMLRRTAVGVYPNAPATTVTLNITNMIASPQIDLKVIGAEMVFIPEGSFEAGGINSNVSTARPINNGTDGNPLTVSSEAAINVQWTNGTNHLQNQTNVGATFPKGFAGFHIMKYETTEGLYATFLNTIPPTMADGGGGAFSTNHRYPFNYGNNRNVLNNTGTAPNVYVAERPHRAQNWLTHRDLFALLDWMALRPITELEYEKSCRGINPAIGDEYPWGSTNATEGRTINLNPENGTEIILEANANANYQNNAFLGGDAGNGPWRVGIVAEVGDSTREMTGASYYGVMDLGGNVGEPTIEYRNGTYIREYGDGMLLYTAANTATHGTHNQAWTSSNTPGNTEVIVRGGAWNDNLSGFPVNHIPRLRVGDRSLDNSNFYTSRQSYVGGRGGR